jgi:serine/threonine protein kinase/tetratricopeptide (TPR) repeat protein
LSQDDAEGKDVGVAATLAAPKDTKAKAEQAPSPATGLGRGESLGRYLVLERLGSGGMGVVYAAYDPELDRKLALKILRAGSAPERSFSGGRTRLLREAQAMARLQHPNVVAVHDVGLLNQAGDDGVFVAMELVDGQTLKSWLKQRSRSWREAVDVFLQAGRGLAAAHAVGIVHRDFKPDNVLLGNDGRVRVADFGLARTADVHGSDEVATPNPDRIVVTARAARKGRADGAGTGPSSPKASDGRVAGGLEPFEGSKSDVEKLTITGALLGTPAYMSPEQFMRQPTDARSDQFSFCVALYEALYGERPFAGETVAAVGLAVLGGKMRPPPKDNRVPAWLRQIVLRGLEVHPERRWPSMDALLAELARDPAQIRRRWLLAAGVVCGLSAVALGVRTVRRQQVKVCQGAAEKLAGVWDPARREAVHRAFLATGLPYAESAFRGATLALDGFAASWVGMHTEACEATRVRGEQSEELLDLRMECLAERREQARALVDLFTRADAQSVQKAVQASSALGGLERCANAAALKAPIRLPTDPAVRAKVDGLRKRLATIKALNDASRYGEALPLVLSVVDDARAIGHPAIVAEALFQYAATEEGEGKYADAEASMVDVAASAVAARDDLTAAEAWVHLVYLSGYLRARYSDGERWAKFAEAGVERSGDEKQRSDLLNNQADLLSSQGKHQEALALGLRALEIRERAYGPDHRATGICVENVAIELYYLGRAEEAMTYYRRAMAIQEKTLGREHPDVGMTLGNVVGVLVDLERYDEAIQDAQRALATQEKALGPDHPDLAVTLDNLGDALIGQGHPDQALVPLRRALAIQEKALGADHPNVADSLTSLGRALLAQHDPRGARALLERALALRESGHIGPRLLAETRFALAQALWETKIDRGRARKLAAQARDGFLAVGGGKKKQADLVDAWLAGR